MSNQRYYSIYRHTGNKAVDMVGACISHYKKNKAAKTKPKRISLNTYHWNMFIDFAKRGGWDVDDNRVDWEGICDIVKGSVLQVKPLEVEFE